jgi:hypothetical protein
MQSSLKEAKNSCDLIKEPWLTILAKRTHMIKSFL